MRKVFLFLLLFSITLLPNVSFSKGHSDHSDHSDHGSDGMGFYIHSGIRIHLDKTFDAEEEKEQVDEASTHSHFEIGYNFNESFSIISDIKVEGGDHGHSHGEEESETPKDKFFEEHKSIVNKLYLNFKKDDLTIYAGKFSPSVGLDFHLFPGAYGYQEPEGYSLLQKIGGGFQIMKDLGDAGTHKFNISTFYADTTSLSHSRINNDGRKKKSDGGVSNTENFSSFAISLEGKDFFSLDNNFIDGFRYKLGYAKQAKGTGGEADEKRMSIGLMHTSYLSEDLKLTLIGEYMDIEKLGGEKGHDRTYTTYGFNLQHGKFTLGGTLTYKDNDATEADENVDDNVRQISLGYYVEENFKVDIGYKRKKVSNEVSEIGGITLYYVFDWPSGGHDHHDH